MLSILPKNQDEDVQNPLQWWRDHQSTYLDLAQMAFDFLAIPANVITM